jgi:hypothetical protein
MVVFITVAADWHRWDEVCNGNSDRSSNIEIHELENTVMLAIKPLQYWSLPSSTIHNGSDKDISCLSSSNVDLRKEEVMSMSMTLTLRTLSIYLYYIFKVMHDFQTCINRHFEVKVYFLFVL